MDDLSLLSELKQRTDRLARANRRLWALGAVCFLVAVAGIALAIFRHVPAPSTETDSTFDQLRTRMLTVVDRQGRPRMRLGEERGGAGISILDATGKPRASLAMDEGGRSSMVLNDDKGTARASVVATPEGMTSLSLFGRKKAPQLVLAIEPTGEPSLSICDTEGRMRGLLKLTPKDKMMLTMLDDSGRPRMSFATESKGNPSAILFGSNDRIGCSMFVLPDDTVCLTLGSNTGGVPRLQLTSLPDGMSIVVLRGSDNNSRTMLCTASNGEGTIEVWDRNRRPRAVIRVAADGTPTITTQPDSVEPRP